MVTSKPFPIPVVAGFTHGGEEDEAMDYMPMPRDMGTYRAPVLPEPEALAGHRGALAALEAALDALRRHLAGEAVAPVDITGLSDSDRALVNQVLGEGEVAAQAAASASTPVLRAQESVFAGVWRVIEGEGAVDGRGAVRDTLEIGAFPRAIAQAALAEARALGPLPHPLPEGTMNAPAVLMELRDRVRRWKGHAPDRQPHVVNLTLLPLTPADSLLFESQLGRGRVQVLSRGYGNCRVVDTATAHVWRVTYFNSQDMIILDTLEVGDVPEVACAARQDLEDSAERLHEVLQWVEQS
jgi:hydrogenase-1 operon protein HyaF